jgi:hypothetical protein
MKNYQILFLLLSLLCAASCKNDDDMNAYESCCGTDPVTFTLGAGKVFIANVITPNFDGINDIFVPSVNSHISKIEDLSIFGTGGELLFTLEVVDLTNPIAGSWQGNISNNLLYKGLFYYTMKIFDDTGQSLDIQGSACSIRCDSEAVIFQTKQGCFFPDQADGDGGADTSFPTYDEDCFGG